MNKNIKTVLLALATATAAIPLTGYAFAQTSQLSQPKAQGQTEAGEVKIQGSIALPAEVKGSETSDAEEEAQYAKLAKITAEQAKQAALAAVPGTVTSVKLEGEDGFLVYKVVIGQQEVTVDAGNGKVLRQDTADADHESENEAGETGD